MRFSFHVPCRQETVPGLWPDNEALEAGVEAARCLKRA